MDGVMIFYIFEEMENCVEYFDPRRGRDPDISTSPPICNVC